MSSCDDAPVGLAIGPRLVAVGGPRPASRRAAAARRSRAPAGTKRLSPGRCGVAARRGRVSAPRRRETRARAAACSSGLVARRIALVRAPSCRRRRARSAKPRSSSRRSRVAVTTRFSRADMLCATGCPFVRRVSRSAFHVGFYASARGRGPHAGRERDTDSLSRLARRRRWLQRRDSATTPADQRRAPAAHDGGPDAMSNVERSTKIRVIRPDDVIWEEAMTLPGRDRPTGRRVHGGAVVRPALQLWPLAAKDPGPLLRASVPRDRLHHRGRGRDHRRRRRPAQGGPRRHPRHAQGQQGLLEESLAGQEVLHDLRGSGRHARGLPRAGDLLASGCDGGGGRYCPPPPATTWRCSGVSLRQPLPAHGHKGPSASASAVVVDDQDSYSVYPRMRIRVPYRRHRLPSEPDMRCTPEPSPQTTRARQVSAPVSGAPGA